MKRFLYPFVFLVLVSCFQDNNEQQPDVTVQDGYLVFKDKSTFERISSQLKDKPRAYLNAWEQNLNGFESQRSIFERIVDEAANAVDANSQHSSYYTSNKSIFLGDEEGLLDYNLPKTNEFYEAFVNKDGLYKIGNSLIQVKKEKIIEILDGDMAKLKTYYNLTMSDKEKGVLVTTIKTMALPLASFGRVAFDGDTSCVDKTSGGGQKVEGRIYYSVSGTLDINGTLGYPGQWVWRHYIKAEAVNYIKTLGVWRRKNTAQLRVVGTVHLGSDYYSIDYNTNGDSIASISIIIYDSGWVLNGTFPVSPYTGDLTFYGRDGTSCTI